MEGVKSVVIVDVRRGRLDATVDGRVFIPHSEFGRAARGFRLAKYEVSLTGTVERRRNNLLFSTQWPRVTWQLARPQAERNQPPPQDPTPALTAALEGGCTTFRIRGEVVEARSRTPGLILRQVEPVAAGTSGS